MDWKALLLTPTDTIRHALEVIDSSGERMGLVVDEKGLLQGIVTDGNIRRALLQGQSLDSCVETAMNPSPVTASPLMSSLEARVLMQKERFLHLPVVNNDGLLLDVLSSAELQVPRRKDTSVVLMVGGLGSRLGELTKDCPKPMLQVGGRPLLETVLEMLTEQGFVNFYFAVNYQADKIRKHFGDGSRFGCNVYYLCEPKPLGTAGALSLLPLPSEDLLVMNGDILTRLDMENLMKFHATSRAPATMVVKYHDITIPYGVVRSDEQGQIISIEEKPTVRHAVSAGINVLSPLAVSAIPKNTRFDIPDLFRLLLAQGHHPRIYQSDEYWLDIGRLADYKQANIEFKDVFGDW